MNSKRVNAHYFNKKSHSEDVTEDFKKDSLKVHAKESSAKTHIETKKSILTKSTAPRNFFNLKERSLLFSNKRYPKKAKNNSLIQGSNISSSGSKNIRETIEIEVFMPIIDEKTSRIFYPKSTKPIVKRYFVKEAYVPKTKENILQSMYFTKVIFENTPKKQKPPVKKHQSKSLFKNALKPQTNVNGTIKKSDVKKQSSLKYNEIDLDKGKTNAKSNSSKGISITSKYVQMSNTNEETKHDNTNNAHKASSVKPNISEKCLEKKNKECISKQSFENGNQIIGANVLKLSIEKACDATVANSLFLGKSINIKENGRTLKKDTSNIGSKKALSDCVTVSNVISQKNAKQKHVLNKQVKSEEIDSKRDESKYLDSRRKKKGENIWRRLLHNYPELKGSPTKNKWRGDLLNNDDNLTIEDWIERCKYIQTRDEYLATRKGSYLPYS